MQPAPLRFVAVEGTQVSVNVRSAAEAKAALRELRHKRKEMTFQKRALTRELKGAQKQAKPPKPSRFAAVRLYQRAKSVAGGMASLGRRIASTTPARTVQAIEREVRVCDDTMFNIDSCIIQVEGKLLHLA